MSKHLLFPIIILLSAVCFGQPDYQFDRITTKDGLSQNSVLAIYQDRFGFMWFGTRDGLNHYNGVNIRIFNHDIADENSLSNSHITHISEDFEGDMWICTLDGLTRYERETETFSRYYVSDSPSEGAILCTFEDSNNNLWVGARAGLFVYDRDENALKPFQFPPEVKEQPARLITSVFEDHKGIIWIGTIADGAFAFDPISYTMKVYNPESRPAMNHDRVEAIAEDDQGNIWLGTYGGGINIWNRSTDTFSYLTKNDSGTGLNNNLVRTVFKDINGQMWIGTFNGLNIYNQVLDSMYLYTADGSNSHSLNNNSIRSIFQDKKGSIWLGTYFGGVNIYDPVRQRFRRYLYSSDSENSLNYNVVSAIIEDQNGNLWIGTERGGLNLYNRSKNHFESFMPELDTIDELPLFTIKSLFMDGDKIWIGTHRRGLYLFDKKTTSFERIFENTGAASDLANTIINYIYQDRNGYFWLCTESYGGVFKFDPVKKRIIPFNLQPAVHELIQNAEVRSVFQDDYGNFWVATKGRGIIVFNEETLYVENFSDNEDNPAGLQSNQVYHITQDSDNNIWVSTYGAGIGKFDRITRGFDFSISAQGLLHDKVYGLIEDGKGLLWIITNRGISRFDKSTNTFKNFDYMGELTLSELTEGAFHFGRYSGNLYFGGVDGLVELDPERFIDNTYVPPVVITGFKLFNTEVKTGDQTGILSKSILSTKEIKLRYNQSIFTIDFIGLNYTFSGNNEYAYMLEGLENTWNYVKNQTFATYTLLNPGEYVFKVKASNNDGLWNETPATLKITVLPPPWKEWYAYLFYAVVIALILYYIRYFGLKSEQLRSSLIIQNLQQEKLRELNEAKIDFFTNISHEFRTPLTLIIGPLKELLNVKWKNQDAHRKLTLVMQNAQLLNRLADQLMDFRKLDSGKARLKVAPGDWVALTRLVCAYFNDYANSRGIALSFKSRYRNIDGMIDTGLMEKALFNVITNAFKNTPKNGKIKIRISKELFDPDTLNDCEKYGRFVMLCNQIPKMENVVVISVEDSGIGINPDDFEKIFEKFYLASDSLSAGTGIGLFIVKNIIELHHGNVAVCSERDKGSIFSLIIPLNESWYMADERKQSHLLEPPPLFDGILPFEYNDIHINEKQPDKNAPYLLIVEDNDEMKKYLASILKDEYRIGFSTSSKEAHAIINHEKPDIIICDIRIKGSNGIQFCESIKRNKALQQIPLIILTADLSEENRIKSFLAGADAYITKPFAPDLLKIRMQNLLASHKHDMSGNNRRFDQTLIGNDEKLLIKINDVVRKMIANPKLNVELLGKEVGMSRMQLYRKVKELTGFTAVEYIREIRLSEAANLLRQDKLSVKEIAGITGFRDIDYFRNQFKKKFNVTPTMFVELERKKNITQ